MATFKIKKYFSNFWLILLLINWISCSNDSLHLDTIIINAKVWTDGKMQDYDAVGIDSDTVSLCGQTADLLKLKTNKTQIIDAAGRFLSPGFTDSHVHFLMGGYNLSSVQLRDASTPQEFIKRIKEFASSQAEGTWIQGGDWNHELWGGTEPMRSWIDSISLKNPIAINRLDGHMILCNSLAMKLAGIDKNTASVAGGFISRDAKGELTGIFKDNAQDLIQKIIPPLTPDQEDKALDAAMKYVSSHGVTTIHHMGSFSDLNVFKRNAANQKLITRIYSVTPLSEWKKLADYIQLNGKGDQWLKWGALKGFMDGSLGSHTAAMFADFSDKPGDKGLNVNTQDDMTRWILAADSASLQICVHAIGDKAISDLLDIFELANKVNRSRDKRFRIEHCQHLDPKDIPRITNMKVIASMQPYHCIDDGSWAEKLLGSERIKYTYAFRSLQEAGVTLAFGSDWFVAPAIPLMGIYAALSRRTLDNKNPEGWVPAQKISIQDALMAYTKNAAYAAFDENKKGSIYPGRLADLVLLEKDPILSDPIETKDIKVIWTMVGGKMVYQAKN